MPGAPGTIEILAMAAIGLGVAAAFFVETLLSRRAKFIAAPRPAAAGDARKEPGMQKITPWADLAGRLLLAQLFIIEAMGKLADTAGAQAYMSHYGLPALLLTPAIAAELGGGVLIALGWQTRLAGLMLAGFCIAAAVIFHADFGDRGQLIHFEKDLALAGALLLLWVRGAGAFSLDVRPWRKVYSQIP